MSRRALITGITGQDGSYLAELLLAKGYEVHGLVRRSSTETFGRLMPFRGDIRLHTGDLLDQRSLADVMRATRPEEIYNLAAMSFVAASWSQPVLTAEFTGVGVTRMLEAMRDVVPDARFYQASSSEMFGRVRETPQTEQTPFYPRSPYGVAKAYGHHITVNYRESYGLFACSGILFNHECVGARTPLMAREQGIAAVRTPADLVPLAQKGPSVQSFEPKGLLELWDGERWTLVRAITATRRRRRDPDHRLISIEGRGGTVEVTAHHSLLDDDGSPMRADTAEPGDRLLLSEQPPGGPEWTAVAPELGRFLGLMAADGHISRDGAKIRFTNDTEGLRFEVAQLWSKLFLGRAREWRGPSGWDAERESAALELTGVPSIGAWLREQLYTSTAHKQVPPLVLNADAEARRAFLAGHYAGDGLKRGGGDSVTTNSAVLAQGLCWLYAREGRDASVYVEHRAGRRYYHLNLPSPVRVGAKGQHLRRDPAEVRRLVELDRDDEWVFDIETESGRLCAGVGRLVIKNSPRRGLEFVTRKVTHAAAAIKLGLQQELTLGNLDARRDWGYAKDYVEMMWRMLQQDEPDDYVVGTGEDHSVRELVDIAFDHVGLDPDAHISLDPALLRPAEVDHLIADCTKAKQQLGWVPETSFEQLVRLMVDADLELLASGAPLRQA